MTTDEHETKAYAIRSAFLDDPQHRNNEAMRIQRKRSKGFKLPDNCICISRGTKWGNPFTVSELGRTEAIRRFKECLLKPAMAYRYFCYMEETITQTNRFRWMAEHLQDLRGKDIACFCSTDEDCHGDVLIELLNESK